MGTEQIGYHSIKSALNLHSCSSLCRNGKMIIRETGKGGHRNRENQD